MSKRVDIHSYGELSYPKDMLSIIQDGLPVLNGPPKKVVIVGAGMAGLVCASLLKQAGHTVKIIEGSDRVGGRIYTLRKPFSEGQYLDVGAMRFPNIHELIFAYIRKFDLPINEFNNENDLYFVNGVQSTSTTYTQNPNVLKFPLAPEEQGKTAKELLSLAVQPYLDLYESASPAEKERLRRKFDRYSFEGFLRFNPLGVSLSEGAIRKVKVLLGIEGFPELSFVDILLDIVRTVFNPDLKFYEIRGGNDLLPEAFLPDLSPHILYKRKVQQIFQENDGVRVVAINRNTYEYENFKGDYVIVTVPYSVMQFIDIIPYDSISFEKWKAIKELSYVSSVKIGLEFKSRFWEELKIANVLTDIPLRYTYSPSPGRQVMLGSYSWGANANLWNSLPERERINEALYGLSKVFGKRVYEEFTKGASYSWSQNEFSAGCFTLFAPNQATDFADRLYTPEGRIHFAGEHTSTFHGWVEGAIESAIRAANEVNKR
ncbi:flavin monoamine oxidase family protein [Halobacillus sp. HZG1]|uniref:flavin monoamine oxidase family protein n=1 Tax=Halobacillus sp. HZG1 TaxID=3111769 RepID=UPI002DBC5CD9|nr:flavin monoamine oxidase family protein [Halobacillus sp. HZG1]MEC3883032.1 flavin monoamine oxidase family protein [Halobacillus sp. HZG1]